MMEHIKLYKYDCIDKDSDEYEMDKIVGKQIVTHLQQFFSKSKRTKTQKNRPKRSSKKKTFRKY